MIKDNTYLSFLTVLSYFPVSNVRLTRRTPVRWGCCHCTSLGTVLRTRTTPRRGGATHTRNRDLEGRNILFNDALNTCYLRLYGVKHMVKDSSDNERVNLLPPHGLLFLINSKG